MAKRKSRTRRSTEEKIAALEARIAELRADAKGREKFSAEAVSKDRERLELSAKDYAELVGVSMITIFSWESGRTAPRPSQVEKWLAVKGMSKEAAWKKLGIEEVPEFNGKAVAAERKRRLPRMRAIIEQQVVHMTRFVGDLLDVSRVSTGKLRLQPVAMDLASVIADVVEACRPAMDARSQRFELQVPEGPIELQGDHAKVTVVQIADASRRSWVERTTVMLRSRLRRRRSAANSS